MSDILPHYRLLLRKGARHRFLSPNINLNLDPTYFMPQSSSTRSRLFYFAFLALMASTCSSPRLCAQTHPPSWLSTLPEETGAVFAVGFSFPYSSLDKTKSEAARNGVCELARYFSVQVRAEIVSWSDEFNDELSNVRDSYYETLDSSLVNEIEKAATLVAHYREPSSNIYYILLRLPVETSDSTMILGRRGEAGQISGEADLATASGSEPSWITRIPKARDAIFAVGYVERYSDPTEARRKSIEKARSQLAMIARSSVANLLDEWAGRNEGVEITFVRKISRMVSNATLHGSQIIGFWSDPHSGESYSLARIFKRSISVSIKSRTSTLIKEYVKPANTTEIEAAADKALDDLDNALKQFNSRNE